MNACDGHLSWIIFTNPEPDRVGLSTNHHENLIIIATAQPHHISVICMAVGAKSPKGTQCLFAWSWPAFTVAVYEIVVILLKKGDFERPEGRREGPYPTTTDERYGQFGGKGHWCSYSRKSIVFGSCECINLILDTRIVETEAQDQSFPSVRRNWMNQSPSAFPLRASPTRSCVLW